MITAHVHSCDGTNVQRCLSSIPHMISIAPVLSASLRRYYPVQVIRVSRSCPLVANGPQSQHPLPQHSIGTIVNYCKNYELSIPGGVSDLIGSLITSPFSDFN